MRNIIFALALQFIAISLAISHVQQFSAKEADMDTPVKGRVFAADEYNQPDEKKLITHIGENGLSPKLIPSVKCGAFNRVVSIPTNDGTYEYSESTECLGENILLVHRTKDSVSRLIEKGNNAGKNQNYEQEFAIFSEVAAIVAPRNREFARKAQIKSYIALSKKLDIVPELLLEKRYVKETQKSYDANQTGVFDTDTIKKIVGVQGPIAKLLGQESTYIDSNQTLPQLVTVDDFSLPTSEFVISAESYNLKTPESGNTSVGNTLSDLLSKGFLQCGVSQGVPGFSNFDDRGNWSGLDVDVCRAVAAAVFGDDSAVKYTPLSAKERFTALQSGEIDVLSRNTSWTATRGSALGLSYAGVNYYDGQGFMVRKDLGVNSSLELGGAAVCTQTGTTTELNVADYFRTNNLDYTVVAYEKSDEVVAAYDSGRCDVYTADKSGLYAQRIKLKNPSAHKILPEAISNKPFGPVVRQGDDEWVNIVKWSLFCMVNAEEMGITSSNAMMKSKSGDPAIKRLLGTEGSFGVNLGISPSWCANIVQQVGNYGESFARNLSTDPLNIARGVNELWSKGGIQYAPPIR